MKRNKRRTALLGWITFALLLAVPAWGGGPLLVDENTRTPFAFATMPVEVFTDLGGLGPLLNAQADGLTVVGLSQWNGVPTATFEGLLSGEILIDGVPTDITLANITEVIGADNGGGIHVIYDTDGSIISDFFGAPPGVLGIATPDVAAGTVIQESWAVLNGAAVDPADVGGASFAGVFTHQLGHAINLAHSQTNGAIVFFGDDSGPAGCAPPYSGAPTLADVETMYPFIDVSPAGSGVEQATINVLDDIATVSDIYPSAAWLSDFSRLVGTVFSSDGISELTGVNVIARNLADPFEDAISSISGDLTQGDLGADGIYVFNGLTPGAEYVVYLDQLVAGTFSTPSTGGLVTLPGPEEFWNETESADPDLDDPCASTPITAVSGGFFIADFIFNSAGGELTLEDDDAVEVDLPFTFPFCGREYNSVFVSSNGFLSFEDSVTANEDFDPSVEKLLDGPPRICALWTDLSPNEGGSVSVDDAVTGELAIIYSDIPEFDTLPENNSNSFTILLRADGTYRVSYGNLDAAGGLAGRSGGGGVPDPGETDLSEALQPIGADTRTLYEFFSEGDNDLAGLTLEFAPCPEAPPAEIAVSPDSLGFTLSTGETASSPLFISNIAPLEGEDLAYSIQENEVMLKTAKGRVIPLAITTGNRAAQKGGDQPSPNADCPWLVASPTSGTVAAGSSDTVQVEVDATGLMAGDYKCQLIITSNAVNAPEIVVPVTLTVLPSFGGHDFVILADTKLSVDGPVSTVGNIHSNGYIHFREADTTTHTGNLSALRYIEIDPGNTIVGDVTAGEEVDNSGVITGTVSGFAAVDSVLLPELSFTAGGSSVIVPRGDSLTLMPGSYDLVQVKFESTLFLSSGEYFMEELEVEKAAVLSVDVSAGPVTVNVVKDLDFERFSEVKITPFGDAGSTELIFNSLQSEDLDIGHNARVLGSIIAPAGEIEMRHFALFKGAICAKEVNVQAGATFLFHGDAQQLPKRFMNDSDLARELDALPVAFELGQNFPNPFNPTTTIRFALAEPGKVRIKIYNIGGQLVTNLLDELRAAGEHQVAWNATNASGAPVASGIYFYSMETASFKEVKKMILLR